MGPPKSQTPEYRAYYAARSFCTNPNDPRFIDHGGCGVEFRFLNFQEFLDVLGLKPSPRHSLGLIKKDGHYEVGNVSRAE